MSHHLTPLPARATNKPVKPVKPADPAAAPVPHAHHHDGPCQRLVDRLLASYQSGPEWMHHLGGFDLPQMNEVVACVDETRALLFPGFVGDRHLGVDRAEVHDYICARLDDLEVRFREQIYRGLHHRCQLAASAGGGAGDGDGACAHCGPAADKIAERFVHALPDIRGELQLDVDAAFEGDPAASGLDEIILSYPGLYAITCYRMASCLERLGAKIVPRMITEHAHHQTGIDIHPGATIGRRFFFDHGTGIVIGATTHIGAHVRIYQGVTLGALSLPKGKARSQEHKKRHPTIEDDVVIYAGATILGGDTILGKGAVVGGNCWVTRSVEPGARVTVDGTTLVKG
jgi:serine O-acetyltransferase